MGILHRHVAREILVPFIIAFVVITLLMLMGELLHELADRFLNKGVALREMAVMVFYVLPPLMTYTMPVALLFATLIAFIQLSQDCEIIAMKAAGIPIRRIFAPAILAGIIITMVLLALRAEVSPWARRKLREFIVVAVLEKPTLVLREQAWTREFNNMRIFVGQIDDKRMLLKDVDMVINKNDGRSRNIVAKEGRLYVGENREKIFLELSEGSIHEYEMEHPDQYSATTFSKLTIPVNIDAINRYIRRYQQLKNLRDKEMPLSQIVKSFFSSSLEQGQKRRLLMEIGERTALAFMPLTFVLIGAPLGIIPYKTRRFYGVTICGILLLTYYSLLILGETLGKKGLMNTVLAMWMPNFFLGVAGIILMVRAERH